MEPDNSSRGTACDDASAGGGDELVATVVVGGGASATLSPRLLPNVF